MYSVMIVDDEALERKGWRMILERYRSDQIRVAVEAKNGKEAVELAWKTRPDIILMDVKMPGLDGIMASKAIKKFLPEVKIIIISAYDDFAYAHEAMQLRAVNYLLKPVQRGDMLDIIDRQLQELENERKRKAEEEELREALQRMMPYIKIGFIFELLAGNVKSAAEIRERAEFLGIKQLPQVILVANIDNFVQLTRNKKEIERQVLKHKIFEKITAVSREWPQSLCIPLQEDKYGILLGPQDGEHPEKLRRRAERLAETIRREIENDPFIHTTVTIGIGRTYREVDNLHLSYKEALRALEYKLYTDGNQVIHIDDVLPYDERIHTYPYTLEKELISSFRIGDRECALQWLEELLSELLSKTNNNPVLLKTRLLQLLLVLSRQAIESGADPEEVGRQDFTCAQELQSKENLNELRKWVVAKVEQLIRLIQESRSQRQENIMKKVVNYIHQHYHRDLTLEEVAEAVHFSPCYLSRIFKQMQKVNFIDYLTRVRLEKAKMLLKASNYSISSIARKVGYQDPKYFSTLFKKHVGCTPSEYRQNIA
ncbi:MAG TPA: response regulator [Syntrophomonadaceae bacterium]|nr:response regulator [Syntrophomonadaceae bacterium]